MEAPEMCLMKPLLTALFYSLVGIILPVKLLLIHGPRADVSEQ